MHIIVFACSMEQTDINILNESKKNDHIYTAVPQVDRTHKIV